MPQTLPTLCRALLLAAALTLPAAAQVTLTQTDATYTLTNPNLTATISKVTGDLVSLKYHNLETMGYISGHHAGYWEQNPSGAAHLTALITIDPTQNHAQRAEIAIRGISGGESLTAHPRKDPAATLEDPATQLGTRTLAPANGRKANAGTFTGRAPSADHGPLLDMEIRYTLAASDHGLYTYAIFTHQPTYAATSLGESRYGFKLNQTIFDWLSVDPQRNALMPTGRDWDLGTDLNMKEARRLTTGPYPGRAEHKYDYCADQFETPAYGWSSTHAHIGLYLINPSMEYLSSGPYHFELTGHLDDGDGGDPTLLDYWRGTHYGGSELPLAANEPWSKIVGPIFIDLESAPTPEAMFQLANAEAKRQAALWPYPWVQAPDYTPAAQRSIVTGRLILKDPEAPHATLPNLMVGLAYPDETEAPASTGRNPRQPITWQNDAKHYEFWTHANPDGTFAIKNVRPGTYQLHAIADGVLGEYAKSTVTVTPGQLQNLGPLTWTPTRYGRQLWQIGIPNRSASEFLMGHDHWHWGLYLQYSKLFPNDVDYTIGKSTPAKDWFIYQVPHATPEQLAAQTATGRGRATPWTIHFTLPDAPTGHAILRLALAGIGTRTLDIAVNNQPAGQLANLIYNATINRDGIEGAWSEHDLTFPATLLHAGPNTLTLTVPAGDLTSGISYDTLRLELAP
jgi:rhamnogalacturonan endolyase